MATPIISRGQAIQAGLKRYFTGKPCKHGHIAERLVNGGCTDCFREANRRADTKAYYKQWAKVNAEAQKLYHANYRSENAETIKRQIREWKKAHPEHITRQTESRRKRLIKDAGRPKPDACEVCEKVTPKLCYDHCHVSEEFRGWLCQQCNSALGMVQDSPEILRRLAAYLERKL